MKETVEKLGLSVTGGQIVARLVANKSLGETGNRIGTIVAKTVKNGYLSHEDIVYNEYRADPDLKKFTKKGDVVIKLTQPLGACLIGEGEENLIVSSFCAIISGFDSNTIDPRFFVAYLNSERGMRQIASLMGGSTIQTISIGNIKGMTIPVPSLEEQRTIGDAFEQKNKTEVLANKLVALYGERVDAMIAAAEDQE